MPKPQSSSTEYVHTSVDLVPRMQSIDTNTTARCTLLLKAAKPK